MSDYQYYALKAVEMQEMATRATTPEKKKEFERLAIDYQRLAAVAWPNRDTAGTDHIIETVLAATPFPPSRNSYWARGYSETATANRLLIVDDHRLMGELIGRIAESAGFTVAITENADDFLLYLGSFAPSVVTLDSVMPGLGGIELLNELATRSCTAKVLLISGADGAKLAGDQKHGQALGLDVAATLSKPFRADELLAVLSGLKT